MADLSQPPALTQAAVRRSRRVSIIWLVPIVAVLIGAWLAWDTWSKQGPTITVTFDSAEGLQAGQSQLKYKDIVFGTVKSLELSPDHNHVIVTIDTTRQAAPLLTDQTVFWVVKPRLFAGNISGLETLLSGSYVGMLPGETTGKPERQFTGREDPPILGAHIPGRIFMLRANRLGSISIGSPVYFRDLDVGQVLGWDIANMADYVTIHAFVRAPYDTYVNDQTRFWNASGVAVKLSGAGIDVQLESLRALLLGGIAFDTPESEATAAATAPDHVYPLFANREAANAASYTRRIPVISYFKGSVAGLAAGSEVTMHGLIVGQVTDVRLAYDAAQDAIVAPVRYEIEPERILGIGAKAKFKDTDEAARVMIQRGLRATLQSASLITGQQEVALEFVPNAAPAEFAMQGEDYILPTAPGGSFASLQASATDLLKKVDTIPFDEIGRSLAGILKAANDLATGPQTQKALTQLAGTIAATQNMVQQLDKGLTPASKQLPEIASGLQKALASTNKLVMSLDSGYGDNTKFSRDLNRLLVQVNDALSSIRALADLLARHPEALIKGRPTGGVE
jgi:paraquat-inducible protein B